MSDIHREIQEVKQQVRKKSAALARLAIKAAKRPRDVDIQAWAKRLAEDVADATD